MIDLINNISVNPFRRFIALQCVTRYNHKLIYGFTHKRIFTTSSLTANFRSFVAEIFFEVRNLLSQMHSMEVPKSAAPFVMQVKFECPTLKEQQSIRPIKVMISHF